MPRRLVFAFLFLALTSLAGQSVSLTGSWRLNVGKSVWGTRPKPVSVILQIDHTEPALAYSGIVIYNGEDSRRFYFKGAVDGKPYPAERSFGSGTLTLRRIDALTIESVFRSGDGTSTETTRTSVTASGKTLSRRIRVESNGATSTSTEIYDRI